MLAGRPSGGALDHIKYLPETDSHNYLMKLVISNMQRYDWVSFYGLNLTETMNLEYYDYLMMVDALKEHQDKVKQALPDVEEELLRKHQLQ